MVALVVLRNKAIKPLLAAAQRRRKSRGAQNPRPIDRHYETIRMAMQRVFDELGLAALCLFGCFSKGPGIGSRSGTGTIYGCQGPDKLKQPDKHKLPKHRQLFFQIVEEGLKESSGSFRLVLCPIADGESAPPAQSRFCPLCARL